MTEQRHSRSGLHRIYYQRAGLQIDEALIRRHLQTSSKLRADGQCTYSKARLIDWKAKVAEQKPVLQAVLDQADPVH